MSTSGCVGLYVAPSNVDMTMAMSLHAPHKVHVVGPSEETLTRARCSVAQIVGCTCGAALASPRALAAAGKVLLPANYLSNVI
jgi:hypothetical protein